MAVSKTSICNRALDLVGKTTFLDITTADSPEARLVKRNYEPVLLRCLRKFDWPFAIKRTSLNPSATAPENEFSYQFNLPSDYVKLCQLWPYNEPHKLEARRILADTNAVTIKYVSDSSKNDPSVFDPNFAEYFAHELAVALTFKVSDSVELRKELRAVSLEMFREAAALFSQEGTDDPMPESTWITCRTFDPYDGDIRITGLE